MEERSIVSYFSGLLATIKSLKEIQKLYDPIMAFNFNSFDFIKPNENKYSQILAFFLDPKQAHGQGDLFLKIFLKCVGLNEKISQYRLEVVNCYCEYCIDDQRRIDVLLIFGNNEYGIGIENKIWANDQNNQLKDYNQFLKKKFGQNYSLLYLTPYQDDPSERSIDRTLLNELKKDGALKSIGYTDHMIDCVSEWAINCQSERVRNFLLDFVHYLKKEFYGENFMEENKILANYISKDTENIELAFASANALTDVKKALLVKLSVQIKEITEMNNLFIGRENLTLSEPYAGFSFFKKTWEVANISFQFDFKGNNGFKHGISLMSADGGERPATISKNLETLILNKFNRPREKNEWWLFSDYFDNSYRNWNNQSQPWIDIQNGKMKSKIDSIVKSYIEIIGSLQI